MVSIRRHARGWRTYLACGGLSLVIFFTLKRKSQCNSNNSHENDHADSVKLKPPSYRYRHYEYPKEEEHRVLEQFSWRYSYRLNIGIALAAIISVGLTFGAFMAARRQAKASEDQLVEAKKQTAIAEKGSRPYVLPVIESDRLRLNPGNGSPNDPRQNPNGYVGIVGFHNYGSVPATITQTEVIITTRPFDDVNRLVYPKNYLTNGIVPSNTTFDQEPYFMPLQPEIGRNLVQGDGSLFFQGRVFYTDVSGEMFHTFFCYLQPTHTHDVRYVLQRVVGVPGCLNEAK